MVPWLAHFRQKGMNPRPKLSEFSAKAPKMAEAVWPIEPDGSRAEKWTFAKHAKKLAESLDDHYNGRPPNALYSFSTHRSWLSVSKGR